MRTLTLVGILSGLLLRWVPAFADDVVTNVTSPLVSYQFPDDFNSQTVTNGGFFSPIASYVYCEWPGNDVLGLASSPRVSYYYPFGTGGAGVSGSFSQVEVLPSSLPADGQSRTTVTVTLLNWNGSPVSGKTVRVKVVVQTADGPVALSSVTPPMSATDGNGQVTVTVSAAMAGTAIISVEDATDGVVLVRQPTIRFGSALVAPGPDLASAIVLLANSSSNLLTRSIAGIASNEGGYGDYFQNQMTADKREQGVNALATGLGGVLSLVASGSKSPLKSLLSDVLKDLGQDFAPDALLWGLDKIAGSSTGLRQVGQKIGSNNGALQRAEYQAEQRLLSGVPPTTLNYLADYQNDLDLRIQADGTLFAILLSQQVLLLDLKLNSEMGHVDLLSCIFKDINLVVTAAGTIVTLSPVGGKAAVTALGIAEGLDTYAVIQRNLNNDQQGYNSAVISLANCYDLSDLIDRNTRAAFTGISQGRSPNPVIGTILSVDSVKTYEPMSGIVGTLVAWGGHVFTGGTYVHVDNAYSDVTIRNTSSRGAAFIVNAFYWRGGPHCLDREIHKLS